MSEINSFDMDIASIDSIKWSHNHVSSHITASEHAVQRIYHAQGHSYLTKTGLATDFLQRNYVHLQSDRTAPRKIGGGASGDITISWGGSDGVKVSGGASAEIHDEHGNYTRGEVRQDSNGEGSAKISAGCKTDK